MQIFTSLVLAASALVSVVSATNHTVIVGQNSLNIFEPTSLSNVAVGDFVAFQFVTKNHTVTQSSFTDPCVAKTGGVNSGFVPVTANSTAFPEWTIQVDNATAPLWFYCAQGAHCKAGMVFAINPTAEKTFAAFLATAQGTTVSSSGSAGAGATVVATATVSGTAASTSQSTTTANSAPGLSSSARSMTLLAALGVFASLTL